MACDVKLREKNIELTKQKVRESVTTDTLLIQALSILETIKSSEETQLSKLKEWYGYYYPELVRNSKSFVEDVIKDPKRSKESIGGNVKDADKLILINTAKFLKNTIKSKTEIEEYIDKTMKELCPNISAVAGEMLGLKIIKQARSLKHLAELPASTIQLLGAEKALFRHIEKKALSPKYGLLFNHPLVQKAKNKGKAARLIADKLAICARIDCFKGKFIGDELIKWLEKQIS